MEINFRDSEGFRFFRERVYEMEYKFFSYFCICKRKEDENLVFDEYFLKYKKGTGSFYWIYCGESHLSVQECSTLRWIRKPDEKVLEELKKAKEKGGDENAERYDCEL